jgi:GMP synthase (glutamine-hydrolysing)
MEKKLLYLDNAINDIYLPKNHLIPRFQMPYDMFNCPSGQLPDSVAPYTHIVISGSMSSVLTPSDWHSREKKLLAEAIAQKKTIMGICFGHQLLAQILFGDDKVRRRSVAEIGWVETKVLIDDPLLGKAGDIIYGFAAHYDEVYDLPKNEVDIISRSPDCDIHGFKVKGHNIWGLQTHFEISCEEGKRYIDSRYAPDDSIRAHLLHGDNPKDSDYMGTLMANFQAL